MCDISGSGCNVDKIYTLEASGRIYRLTFSRSLAEHIKNTSPEHLSVSRRAFILGRRLEAWERSQSRLYAIVDARKNRLLRITLFHEIAQLLQSETRYIAEVWLK